MGLHAPEAREVLGVDPMTHRQTARHVDARRPADDLPTAITPAVHGSRRSRWLSHVAFRRRYAGSRLHPRLETLSARQRAAPIPALRRVPSIRYVRRDPAPIRIIGMTVLLVVFTLLVILELYRKVTGR